MSYGLDFTLGTATLRTELFGDWYRDPWGLQEFSWFEKAIKTDERLKDRLFRKEKNEIRPRNSPTFNLLEIPKSYLGIRPGVLLPPESRILYASAVTPYIRKLHSGLPEWVYGWRSRGDSGLRSNTDEREDYLAQARKGLEEEWVLKTDITSCFASIDVDLFSDLLVSKLGNTASFNVIMSIVQEHNKLVARTGLPQRSFASAALANIFLEPIDRYLSRLIEKGKIKSAIRWMDDIHIFGDKHDLYEVNAELHQRVRSIKLEMNSSKSALIRGEEASIEFQLEGKNNEIREKRVLVQIKDLPSAFLSYIQTNTQKLRELEESILHDPHQKDTPPIGGILRALRRSRIFENHQRWIDISPEIPAQAASLGRYLREAANSDSCNLKWEALESWFLTQVDMSWACLDWTKAQLALSFNSHESISRDTSDRLSEWIEHSDDIQLITVALQRLSHVRPNMIRDIARERIDKMTDPMMQRNFALTLLGIGEEKPFIKKIINKDPLNSITNSMIEERNYKPVPIVDDFDQSGDS